MLCGNKDLILHNLLAVTDCISYTASYKGFFFSTNFTIKDDCFNVKSWIQLKTLINNLGT